MLRFALALIVAALAAAPTAAASTVGEESTGDKADYPELFFRAAPGERNDVRVSRDGDKTKVVDTGSRLEPVGLGCTRVDDHTALCSATYINVLLGDGDDRAQVAGVSTEISGGDGDDTIQGGEEGDQIAGGPGRDAIDGGAGADWITGDDRTAAPDRLTGGDGQDRLIYTDHPRSVTVRLGQGESFAGAGEEDTVAGFEHAEGSAHTDDLIGDDGPNRIHDGHDGGDKIVGGGGNDDISAGGGGTIDTGAGDDRIWVVNDPPAKVDCGPDIDSVSSPNDDVLAGCERWYFMFDNEGSWLMSAVPVVTTKGAKFTVPCPHDAVFPGRCTGALTIERVRGSRRQVAGRARFTIDRRRRKAVTVPLSARDRRALRSTAGLAVRVRLSVVFRERGTDSVIRGRGGFFTTLSTAR